MSDVLISNEHANEIGRLMAENERLRAILLAVWEEGMQDGLSHDLRQRVDAEVGDVGRSR